MSKGTDISFAPVIRLCIKITQDKNVLKGLFS